MTHHAEEHTTLTRLASAMNGAHADPGEAAGPPSAATMLS
jgi:hypothetical protein